MTTPSKEEKMYKELNEIEIIKNAIEYIESFEIEKLDEKTQVDLNIALKVNKFYLQYFKLFEQLEQIKLSIDELQEYFKK